MVKFLKNNKFQIFNATLQKKINSVGQYIDNTVPLYSKANIAKT